MACLRRWPCVLCKRETEKGLLGKERHMRGVVARYTQVWNGRMDVCMWKGCVVVWWSFRVTRSEPVWGL